MIEFKTGRDLKPGQLVKVYRNLNRDCFTIMDKQSRLVLGWAEFVMLKNVKFVVSKAGQAKVREKGVRNVHAFAVGEFVASAPFNFPRHTQAYYDPYKTDTFIDCNTKSPVTGASVAFFINGKCFIS